MFCPIMKNNNVFFKSPCFLQIKFAENFAKGNIRRKQNEKYAIFLSDWEVTCKSSLHKIQECEKSTIKVSGILICATKWNGIE